MPSSPARRVSTIASLTTYIPAIRILPATPPLDSLFHAQPTRKKSCHGPRHHREIDRNARDRGCDGCCNNEDRQSRPFQINRPAAAVLLKHNEVRAPVQIGDAVLGPTIRSESPG